ncbi:hypothetical protein OsJ_07436 [Oryza sativa Japonica Group]|uniref:Cyclin N-terminal domain-containing protein n=1 Tax=Oryza sativa subsp. japonica TaxID=39947 RepID=A3A8U3_ORYSJ|nr:hypothetical protein OsJ_07436 [Oryza sativa Japonica Group]
MFGPYSGGGGVPLPQMDADTYVRTIAAMPPHPLAPPPDSPRTPHTYVGFLPVFGDLPPLTGAVLQEPVPVPPEQRADQPVAVATENSGPTRPQLCAPYDDEVEATLRAMETNPAGAAVAVLLETTQVSALFGATAVFLAAKYEDQYTLRKIDASMVAARCGYTSETRHKMVSIMETEMLAALGFNLGGPTAYTFVEHFTRYYGDGEEEKQLKEAAHRVADGTLLTYGFHRYLPSMVAASSIFLARLHELGHEPWSNDLAELTGYKAIDLMGCVCDIYSQIACPRFALLQEYFFEDP